jgi:hypothetical protein
VFYNIRANHKTYEVSEHAADRMRERDIAEDMVIITLEEGSLYLQHHRIDRYEYEFVEEDRVRIIQVAVNEPNRIIVSVIEDTESR